MDAFYTAAGITFGVLLPIIVVLFIIILVIIASSVRRVMAIRLENAKKAPPFDEVDVNVSPATRVMTVRFIKKGVIIYEGSSSQININREGPVVFDTKESE